MECLIHEIFDTWFFRALVEVQNCIFPACRPVHCIFLPQFCLFVLFGQPASMP